MLGNFYSAGQVCSNGTRVFVQKGLKAKFLERLAARSAAILLGDPLDEATQMGPLVSAAQLDKVLAYIETAKAEGATLVCGGGRAALNTGYYVQPTVFADVTDAMTIAREEVFGPVLAIMVYDDVEQAIQIANDTAYGLSGYVWGTDVAAAKAVAARLRTGMVHLNGASLDSAAPFGGYKMSGIGREWGVHGLEEFLEIKSVYGGAA